MSETNTDNNELLLFNELSKEQKKALQKEFSQTTESKKMNRMIIILAVIFGAVVMVSAIIGIYTGSDGFYITFPVFFIVIWPAIISQQKFEKWLADEKGIAMKREK